MKRLLLALLLVAWLPAHAGTIGVYATPTTDNTVTHLRVYANGNLVTTAPVGELVPMTDPLPGQENKRGVVLDNMVPDNCVTQSYTLTWVVDKGDGTVVESQHSEAVAGIARPSIAEVLVTQSGIRQIIGQNFTDDAQAYSLDGPVPVPLTTTFGSCQVLEVNDTAARTIQVDAGNGLLPFTFTIPLSPPTGAVTR